MPMEILLKLLIYCLYSLLSHRSSGAGTKKEISDPVDIAFMNNGLSEVSSHRNIFEFHKISNIDVVPIPSAGEKMNKEIQQSYQ